MSGARCIVVVDGEEGEVHKSRRRIRKIKEQNKVSLKEWKEEDKSRRRDEQE